MSALRLLASHPHISLLPIVGALCCTLPLVLVLLSILSLDLATHQNPHRAFGQLLPIDAIPTGGVVESAAGRSMGHTPQLQCAPILSILVSHTLLRPFVRHVLDSLPPRSTTCQTQALQECPPTRTASIATKTCTHCARPASPPLSALGST